MDEIVVRLARTIASLPRLRILSRLAVAGEVAPSRLARELRVSQNALSADLAKLAAAGLVKRRHSGIWSYCVADSPYGPSTVSGKLHAWLRQVLANPSHALGSGGREEGRRLSAEEAQVRSYSLIFEAATAFTDLRRLQILRHLAAGGDATTEALCRERSMSVAAVSRHMEKLIRRGYVALRRQGRRGFYRLAPKFKTPIHGRLFEIVRSTWSKT